MRCATLLVLLPVVWATACDTPTEPAASVQMAVVQEVLGETGDGALYAMHVPDAWNGSLVLYAHGINSGDELTLEDENLTEVRTALNDLGYAVAYSSWSQNGWAVRDGVRRTHQLSGLFTSRFERPERVYLVGRSLGAMVVQNLAETYPAQYDGVLPVCGMLGGGPAAASFFFNTWLLFDFYYPGVLPGHPLESPLVDAKTAVGLAKTAIKNDAAGAIHIAEVMAAIGMPLPVVPGPSASATLMGSILTPLGYAIGGFDGLVANAHGQVPFDNWDTDYVIPDVQADIARFRGHSAAMNFMEQEYQPTGRLQIPMVALDNLYDPAAPGFHKDMYETLLTQAGAAHLLSRVTVDEYGHCPASPGETVSAFLKLAAWVETGVKP
jgi:pimeloyl-ACP methyl ester carboxylesterase